MLTEVVFVQFVVGEVVDVLPAEHEKVLVVRDCCSKEARSDAIRRGALPAQRFEVELEHVREVRHGVPSAEYVHHALRGMRARYGNGIRVQVQVQVLLTQAHLQIEVQEQVQLLVQLK